MAGLLIRDCTDDDLAAVAAIYGWHVAHGSGTFETEAPDAAEIGARRAAILALGLPWLAAERDGRVVGYAYANRFRARAAYAWCVEDSVYVDDAARGHGVGRLLLAELIARCTARGARQMLALVGDSANLASIGLHEALGFRRTGVLEASGWKHGRWLDVVVLQRALGQGAALPPAGAGA